MSAQTYENGVLIEKWDDRTRTYTDYRTDPPTVRDYTEEENMEADQRFLSSGVKLEDLETRVRRIEEKLWPSDPIPDPGTPPEELETIPTFSDYGGVWPNGTLLKDAGRYWRNVSGVPLTTPPTGFPGGLTQWTHLFVEVSVSIDPDPDPEPSPDYDPWSPNSISYVTGDIVEFEGAYYICRQNHTSQSGWTPAAVPALWEVTVP